MSTLITTGFKYVGKKGLLGAYETLHSMKSVFQENDITSFNKGIADDIGKSVDMYFFQKYNSNVVHYCTHDIKDRFRPLSHWRVVHKALWEKYEPLKAVLFPMGKRKVIGLLTGSRADNSGLLDHPLFTDYSYWNNTDKSESVPAREWNARKKDWQAAFKLRTTETGLTFQLSSCYGPYIDSMVKYNNNKSAYVPSIVDYINAATYERRVDLISYIILVVNDMSWNDYLKYVNTEKYQEDLQFYQMQFNMLVPAYTEELITTDITKI